MLAYVLYSAVWIAAVAVAQLSGALTSWRDTSYMLFGIGCALPAWGIALAQRSRHELACALYLAITTFLQMAIGSHLFFREFGLTYRFQTTISLFGSPLFLYPLTIAYFTTYYLLFTVVRMHERPLWMRAAISYGVAFAETFFMCNAYMEPYFTYTPPSRMMWLGSIAYGAVFFFTAPSYTRLRDRARAAPGWKEAILRAVWDNVLALSAYAVYALLLRL